MASIKINEIDNTIKSPISEYNDNIVYVPGNAITGPVGIPTLCTNYESFIKTFGDHSPSADDDEIGTAWDYAANILLSGTFSVLFERIAPFISNLPTAVQATASIQGQGSVTVGTVNALYGGSFGNSLSYSIFRDQGQVRFRTYKSNGSSYVLLEDIKIINTTGDMSMADIKSALLAKIGTGLDTDYVRITVSDAQVFDMIPVSNIALSGGSDPTDTQVNAAIPSAYDKLTDKYLYDIKFLSSGNAYNMQVQVSGVTTNIDVVEPMKTVAETRQDCTAFINVPIGMDKEDVQDWVKSVSASSYVTAHAPWQYVSLSTGKNKWMSPSFVALLSIARSVKMGYQVWEAPAGVSRSTVPFVIKPEYEIGNAILDLWQNSGAPYVNPIMYLLKYGYTIFGQRTTYMVDGSGIDKSSLQELSVRLTANEIKKKIHSICTGLSFESNNIRTWNSFRGSLIPFLDNIKSNNGLEKYEVVMDESTTTSADVSVNRIVGTVRVIISRSAEDFVINFTLEPSGTKFDEE